MKKIILSLIILLSVGFFRIDATLATTKAVSSAKKVTTTKVVKKKAVDKSTKKTVTTMKWNADALKLIGNIASFDYNYSIRNAVIKKIENYAKRRHIKVITAKMINSMNE
jgi:hypothetical protein